MKSKVIMTCFCVCMLGITTACSGDEQATNANSETAKTKAEPANAPKAPEKPAAKNMRKEAAPKAAKPMDDKGSASPQMTNKDCFPETMPESPSNNVTMCMILTQSHPDMAFTKTDFDSLPEDCKAIVLPKCRFSE